MTAKFNADILARLGEASPEELSAALAAIREDVTQYQGAAVTQESVAAIRSLTEAARAIKGEQAGRQELAESGAAALSELTAELAVTEVAAEVAAEVAEEAATESETTEEAGEDTQEGEAATEDEGDAEETATATESEEETVTASARKLGGVQTKNAATTSALPQIKFTTTAAAPFATAEASAEFGGELDRKTLATAFAAGWDTVRNLSHSGGRSNGRVPVATVRTEYPEDRHLRRDADSFANLEKVDRVVEAASKLRATDNGAALVAAGLCAPLEPLYDIRVVGDVDRPVRDALVRFGADRGGITYRPALNGVGQTGGIGFWGEAEDEADPLVAKACAEIACPGVLTAQVEAIYKCLTFSNMSTRFDPEFMDSVIRAQAIAHARIAENRLLTALTTGSTRVYSTKILGATRDVLVTMDKMVAYYRSVHRLSENAALRFIAPSWLKDLMRADLTRQMVGDGLEVLAVEDSQIADWFRRRNVNVTWHLDGIDPANIPAPVIDIPNQIYSPLVADDHVPPFPDVVSTLLFAEGDWLYLDGGTLDLGMVRDSTLNGLNRFQTFSESWEAPVFRGIESFHMALRLQPTGQSAATVDTSSIGTD